MRHVFIARMRHTFALFVTLAGFSILCSSAHAQPAQRPEVIEAVTIHPFIAKVFVCREHYEGEQQYLLDALGADCYISTEGRTYRTDGKSNEDYYIWGEPVLAPFDGTVVEVSINPVVNTPGQLGKSPPGAIVFRRADGIEVVYAHLDRISVKKGDRVTAGQPVAVVSNNGISRGPHVHIGARRDQLPLQIRWDLRAMGELQRRRGQTDKRK